MKRKRLLLFLGCSVSILLAGYATLRLTAPRDRINQENIEKICKEMSEKEVESILGVPAGVYSSIDRTGLYESKGWYIFVGSDLIQSGGGKEWVGRDVTVLINFDEHGRVSHIMKGRTKSSLAQEGAGIDLLAKLRRWLGMQ